MSIHTIQKTVAPLQQAITTHPLLAGITSLAHVQHLMAQHVFAVWDFVNLIKALHSRLTATIPPWWPPQDPDAVRLLSAILLEEETDENPAVTGEPVPVTHYCSHFTLYLQAMAECGADTTAITACRTVLTQGETLTHALDQPGILPTTRQFVQHTFATFEHASLPALAASFVFGREAMVPHFFTPWLAQLEACRIPHTDKLRYYLTRHLALDSESHFPQAAALLERLCGQSADCWQQANTAAQAALTARLAFLNGLQVAFDIISQLRR